MQHTWTANERRMLSLTTNGLAAEIVDACPAVADTETFNGIAAKLCRGVSESMTSRAKAIARQLVHFPIGTRIAINTGDARTGRIVDFAPLGYVVAWDGIRGERLCCREYVVAC